MIRYPLRFLCWFRPHKWRRLRKSDNEQQAQLGSGLTLRICRRCGATRLAKARARKS
jgi:hypothetical protein